MRVIARISHKRFNIDQGAFLISLDIFSSIDCFFEVVRQQSFLSFEQVSWIFTISQCCPGFMGVHPFPCAQLMHEHHSSWDGTTHFNTVLLLKEQFIVVCDIWEFPASPKKEVISVSFLDLIVVPFKIVSLLRKNGHWTVKLREVTWITLLSPWHHDGVLPLYLFLLLLFRKLGYIASQEFC